MRTVALAPGRTGDLARDVPVLAPARRSFAALGALRAEARWADAVLLRGPRAAPPGIWMLRGLPRVLVLDGTARSAGAGMPQAIERLSRRVRVDAVQADGDRTGADHVAAQVASLLDVPLR